MSKYKKLAEWGRRLWMKHGALHYYECFIDEFTNHGLGFKKLCKLKRDETAIFAFIVYKSKAHRNRVNKKVISEMDKDAGKIIKMPFEMKRFSMAGCKVLVSSK